MRPSIELLSIYTLPKAAFIGITFFDDQETLDPTYWGQCKPRYKHRYQASPGLKHKTLRDNTTITVKTIFDKYDKFFFFFKKKKPQTSLYTYCKKKNHKLFFSSR